MRSRIQVRWRTNSSSQKRRQSLLVFRRLENISDQYPDALDLIKEKIDAKEAILEAECVAMDLETGDMRPFQELMHRRRKYGVEAAIKSTRFRFSHSTPSMLTVKT